MAKKKSGRSRPSPRAITPAPKKPTPKTPSGRAPRIATAKDLERLLRPHAGKPRVPLKPETLAAIAGPGSLPAEWSAYAKRSRALKEAKLILEEAENAEILRRAAALTAATRSPGTPSPSGTVLRRRPGGQRKVDLDDFTKRGEGLTIREQMAKFNVSYKTIIRYRGELRREAVKGDR
jgi:hypothetical protein